jgi:hypothetical protein
MNIHRRICEPRRLQAVSERHFAMFVNEGWVRQDRERMSTVVLPMKKIEPAVKSADRMDGNTHSGPSFLLGHWRRTYRTPSSDSESSHYHAQIHMTFAVATRLAADKS